AIRPLISSSIFGILRASGAAWMLSSASSWNISARSSLLRVIVYRMLNESASNRRADTSTRPRPGRYSPRCFASGVSCSILPSSSRAMRSGNSKSMTAAALISSLSLNCVLGVHGGNLLGRIAQAGQHFVRVFAEQRRALDFRRQVRKLDRAAHGQILAARLVLDLDDGTRLAQRRVLGDLLHGEHRCARNVELAQDVDGLELGLVGEPRLDIGKDVEDLVLARLGRVVGGIVYPFRLADGAADRLPGMALDGEVDIGVGILFPALALQHPARLSAAAGIAAARHHVGKLAVRILRV